MFDGIDSDMKGLALVIAVIGVVSLCGAAIDRISEAKKCEPVRYVCRGALTYDNGVATCRPTTAKGGDQ
jgi:hypothetical protein